MPRVAMLRRLAKAVSAGITELLQDSNIYQLFVTLFKCLECSAWHRQLEVLKCYIRRCSLVLELTRKHALSLQLQQRSLDNFSALQDISSILRSYTKLFRLRFHKDRFAVNLGMPD